ncbi:threonine-phosphate decarboxylase CobD [Brucella sp. BE17]|uniref:threonine-phosphate decarboxylase CobD n=1 Tax=Brucella sp. BE17 TaxID=3142977 RepID=UPI0031BB47D8
MSHIEHGGALDGAIAVYGGAAEDWLDLSTGINPEHFLLPPLPAALWNRLPDESLSEKTIYHARRYYGVAEGAAIVAAPGTQALIQLIPTLTKPATVAVLTPTYQEHARCFEASGWSVVKCASLDAIPESASVAVIVNPNNPDGRVIAREDLVALAKKLGSRGGFLIVDEAFADPHPAVSIVPHMADAPLIVLKSFGKFFGLAGIRLGFAIGPENFASRIAQRLGPWAVPGPTLAIAAHAFSEEQELQRFRARLNARRKALTSVLERTQLTEIGGTELFALVETPQAEALYERLCQRHILVRKFSYAPHWLRIGLALDEVALLRLEQALTH